MQTVEASRISFILQDSEFPEVEKQAVEAYAVAWNTFNFSVLTPFLAEDVILGSQLKQQKTIHGIKELREHFNGRFEMFNNGGLDNGDPIEFRVYAELAVHQERNVVFLARGNPDERRAMAVLDVNEKSITRIFIYYLLPHPNEVEHSGRYPTSLDDQTAHLELEWPVLSDRRDYFF